MKSRLALFCLCILGTACVPLCAKPAKTEDNEVVKMDPVVVEASSLSDAGFKFKAKFRPHFIGTGIRELVVVEVGPQSTAKKAGLAVGDRILQIRDVKVEGLGIQELQHEFETKAVDGKVTLLVKSKGSTEPRNVELQFTKSPLSNDPKPSSEANRR